MPDPQNCTAASNSDKNESEPFTQLHEMKSQPINCQAHYCLCLFQKGPTAKCINPACAYLTSS